MTCVVGLVHKHQVWMGSDSAGVSSLDIRTRSDPKIFKVENFLFGCCGSFRMINLLRYDFGPPINEYDIDGHEFISTIVINEIRRAFTEGGFTKFKDGEESGGTFLIGYQGQLYFIDEDYQVGTYHEEFAAIGCGSQYAMGVLYAMPKAPPKKKIIKALEAAEKYSVAVRSPFTILHT